MAERLAHGSLMDVFVSFLDWSSGWRFLFNFLWRLSPVISHVCLILTVLCVEVYQKVILWFVLIRSIALLIIPWGHAIFKTSSKVVFSFKFIRLKICCVVNVLLQFLKHHFQTLKSRLVRRLLQRSYWVRQYVYVTWH